MTKTIVFFLADLQSGGTEWFALRLARGLLRRGYRPVFLVGNKNGELLSLVEKEFEIVSLDGRGYSLASATSLILPMVRFLKTYRPDVLISGLPLLNAAAGLAVLFAKVPLKLLLVEHMRLRCAMGRCGLRDALRFALVKASHLLSRHVICVSSIVARDLKGSGAEHRCKIIPNPVIPDDFAVLEKEPPDHPWLLQKNGPVIVSVGRLLEVKNYPMLLSAFARLVEQRPDARLVIFGEGEERFKIEYTIAQLGLGAKISLAGVATNVFKNLKAADLFVMASNKEAFGNVVVEALATGTKIVCTDCGGPREILEDGKYGYLVPVDDPETMARIMMKALDEPWDRQKLRERGLSYTTEKATSAYLDIIES